jgi:hypothetical protein
VQVVDQRRVRSDVAEDDPDAAAEGLNQLALGGAVPARMRWASVAVESGGRAPAGDVAT